MPHIFIFEFVYLASYLFFLFYIWVSIFSVTEPAVAQKVGKLFYYRLYQFTKSQIQDFI